MDIGRGIGAAILLIGLSIYLFYQSAGYCGFYNNDWLTTEGEFIKVEVVETGMVERQISISLSMVF
jgi:hypothetical protein